MKILYLSLKKDPFDVMVTGEKTKEYRKFSKWIKSRLFDNNGNPKIYDLVKFVNGYGSDKPYFICKFDGVIQCDNTINIEFSNGLSISGLTEDDYIIKLGKIVEVGNLK